MLATWVLQLLIPNDHQQEVYCCFCSLRKAKASSLRHPAFPYGAVTPLTWPCDSLLNVPIAAGIYQHSPFWSCLWQRRLEQDGLRPDLTQRLCIFTREQKVRSGQQSADHHCVDAPRLPLLCLCPLFTSSCMSLEPLWACITLLGYTFLIRKAFTRGRGPIRNEDGRLTPELHVVLGAKGQPGPSGGGQECLQLTGGFLKHQRFECLWYSDQNDCGKDHSVPGETGSTLGEESRTPRPASIGPVGGLPAPPKLQPESTQSGPERHDGTSRPRLIIACLQRHSQTRQVLQATRTHGPFQIDKFEVRITADYSKDTTERRKAFLSTRPRLRHLAIKCDLFDPARMWIAKNGVSRDFYNPEDLRLFLDSFQIQIKESVTPNWSQDTMEDDGHIPSSGLENQARTGTIQIPVPEAENWKD
ncbi:hypothetical protein NDU88_003179 [Pleurodeles waltl]|uniref:Uncharacterized protein n=1 Tax=Pleurodeles waltl TaxID=8319 RepID=A0AAV7NJX6_PLEWA|nr:hypothetical protein NDU88_003179 [Pleurodeles waltl]